MHPILYDFGFISLKSYGLMLAIAFFVGIYLAKRNGIKEGIDPKFIDSLAFGIIISAIVGARFFHALTVSPGHYLRHPIDIFKINQGGLVFYGGFIFAIGFSIWYCHRKKIRFLKIADIMAAPIAIGLMFTRMGCFLAGCCYGKECDLPWAVTFTDPHSAALTGTPLHPTQIYASLNGFLIFLILIIWRKYKRFEGELFLALLFIYSVTRSGIEMLRSDHRGGIGFLSTSQIISVPIFLFALYMITKKRKQAKGIHSDQ